MREFENKVAIVTGASAGIGFATAQQMARQGAIVVIAARNPEHVQDAVDKIMSDGGIAYGQIFDASHPESAASVVEQVSTLYGAPDILVNNVGGSDLRRDNKVSTLDLDYFDEVMRLNVASALAMTKAVLPHMMERRTGSIVNVASIGGITADGAGTMYGMSKAAAINMVRYVATQYGKYNIRCNGVAPGLILTKAATDNLPDDIRHIFLEQNALPYLGKPEDVAEAICFLASDRASYVTGQTLIVDGGLTCHNPTVAAVDALRGNR